MSIKFIIHDILYVQHVLPHILFSYFHISFNPLPFPFIQTARLLVFTAQKRDISKESINKDIRGVKGFKI